MILTSHVICIILCPRSIPNVCAESDIEFRKFQPTPVVLLYQDPVYYAEIFEIEGENRKKEVA